MANSNSASIVVTRTFTGFGIFSRCGVVSQKEKRMNQKLETEKEKTLDDDTFTENVFSQILTSCERRLSPPPLSLLFHGEFFEFFVEKNTVAKIPR